MEVGARRGTKSRYCLRQKLEVGRENLGRACVNVPARRLGQIKQRVDSV